MGITTKELWKCDCCDVESAGQSGWGKYQFSGLIPCPCPDNRPGCAVLHHALAWTYETLVLCPVCVAVVRAALGKWLAEIQERRKCDATQTEN